MIPCQRALFPLTAKGAPGAASGTDCPLDLKFGSLASASKPLGVKIMKARTVRVRLYPVTLTGHGAPNPPDLAVNAASVAVYLRRVFRAQPNAVPVVTDGPALSVNWDLDSDGGLDSGTDGYMLGGEQKAIQDLLANEEDSPDIRVFLMSGTKLMCDGEAKGLAFRKEPDENGRGETNACWIFADNLPAIELGEIPRRIAHEMGHVLVGYGHPDEPANHGPAPLPGTDPRIRLMVSGTNNGIAPGELLVKGEWDAAEKWLVKFIDQRDNQ